MDDEEEEAEEAWGRDRAMDESVRLAAYTRLLSCLRLPRMSSDFLCLVVARDPYLEFSGKGAACLARALWWRDAALAFTGPLDRGGGTAIADRLVPEAHAA